MEYFLSSRGGRKLSFEGYIYSIDREDKKTEKIYWKCENRACKGRLITGTANSVLKRKIHDQHEPDIARVEVQKCVARIRATASVSQEAPAKIVNKELATDLPAEFRAYFPKESAVKRTIQRQRRQFIPETPKSLDDLTIPDDWQTTTHGTQFLLCDVQLESDRLIIFCTDGNLRQLCRSHVWYGDGTFSVAPKHFYQLYTVHWVVMGQLLPLAYCLLTRKTRLIYAEMFSALKFHANKRSICLSVSELRVDFEDACIKAFTDVFPAAIVECCFFHLSQAHWRKITDLGLRTRYIEDENFAQKLRMFTALAFVPPENVYSVFAELCESVAEVAEEFIP